MLFLPGHAFIGVNKAVMRSAAVICVLNAGAGCGLADSISACQRSYGQIVSIHLNKA
jgi:hypothetical protein